MDPVTVLQRLGSRARMETAPRLNEGGKVMLRLYNLRTETEEREKERSLGWMAAIAGVAGIVSFGFALYAWNILSDPMLHLLSEIS